MSSTGVGERKRLLITDFFQSSKRHTGTKKVSDEKEIRDESKKKLVKDDNNIEKEKIGSHEKGTTTDTNDDDPNYEKFCARYNFNKQTWVASLNPEERELLDTEIKFLHVTWLVFLHKTLTKPYFLNLKKFLKAQKTTVFPPQHMIYSWSHYTPLPKIKCLILGQDPYHNYNQAHGLAFSVLEPTPPPPSLVNIYKTLALDYSDFIVPDPRQLAMEGKKGGGNLTKWARRGILMLNACLTVEAHKANSHSGRGWETFTEEVIRVALNYFEDRDGFAIMAWGSPAQNRISKFYKSLHTGKFLVLKTVHPSPLSAHRGFFNSQVFKKCNEWLEAKNKEKIDWGLIEGNIVV